MLRRLFGFHALHVAGGASNEQGCLCLARAISVGGQSVCLAPPGSSWLPPGCGWLLPAPPGSSRLLLAPPALHPPLASAVRPWGARAVLRPEHSRGGRMVSKWLYHPYDMQPSKFVTGSMGTQQWPLEFRSPPPVPRLLQAPRGPLPPQAPSGTIKERCPEYHKGPCKALCGS